jgi:hypothetical protein
MVELTTIKMKQHSTSCVPIEQLFALAHDQLSPVDAGRVGVHLDAGCDACGNQLNQLQKLVDSMTHRELVDLPAWLMRQAMNFFTWHRAKSGERQSEAIPAILVVDSFADGRLLGFRGAGPMSRQLLYRAGEYDIDLSLDYMEPTQLVDIMGQPMPLNADASAVAGAQVKLLEGTQLAFGTQTNEFGEFIIDGVRQGLYDLRLELKDGQINIVGLNAIFHTH